MAPPSALARWVTSPRAQTHSQTTPDAPKDGRAQTPEAAPDPSPNKTSSPSSSDTSSFSVSLPEEVLICISHSLQDIDALGTLASVSLTCHDNHDLVCPILFEDIVIRNHRQLASILSSLDPPPTDSEKRHTRLSGPNCDPVAKLARFSLTKRLSINHLPSPDNFAKLSALQESFVDTSIFSSVELLHLSPILTHNFHPAANRKALRRIKQLNLINLLACPTHLSLDLRGGDADFHRRPLSDGPHGCACVAQFCDEMGKLWKGKEDLRQITVYVDAATLSTHYFPTSASGPSLNLVFTPPATPSPPASPPVAKKARKPNNTTEASMTLEALAKYLSIHLRQAKDYKGGVTTITIQALEGEEEGEEEEVGDLDDFWGKVKTRVKEMDGDEDQALLGSVKARQMMAKGFCLAKRGPE